MSFRTAALATAAVLLPGLAAAAGPKVYVAPYGSVYGQVPTQLGVKTAALLAEELKAQGAVTLLAGPELEAAAPAASGESDYGDAKKKAERAFDRGDKLSAQADESMMSLQFAKAIKRYEAAIKQFEQNAEHLDDFGRLVYIKLSLATALFRTGKEDAGEELLGDVVRLDPHRVLDPELYPPVFIRTFDRIRKRILPLARGTVSVTSAPAGSAVFLNGKPMGKTPVLLKDVVRGEHFLKVVAEGVTPHFQTVQASPARIERVRVQFGGGSGLGGTLGALAGALSSNELNTGAQKAVKTLARDIAADYVVVGAIAKGENVYHVKSFLYDARADRFGELSDVAFDFDLLGVAIEVYKLGGEIAESVGEFPVTVDLPQALFADAVEERSELTEVVVAPTAPTAAPATVARATHTEPQTPPIEPERPAGPVSTGPVVSAEPERRIEPERPVRIERERPSGPVGGPVVTAPAGPVRPGGSGPVIPADERDPEPEPEREVSIVGRTERLEALNTGGVVTMEAIEADEVVIPKDEIKQEEGWPWWAWGLTVLAVGGALGAGGIYAAQKGVFTGPPESGNITFRW